MEKLEIEFSKIAAKEYKRIPRDYQSLIDQALKKLSEGLPVDRKPRISCLLYYLYYFPCNSTADSTSM